MPRPHRTSEGYSRLHYDISSSFCAKHVLYLFKLKEISLSRVRDLTSLSDIKTPFRAKNCMKPFYFPTNLFRSSFSLGGKCYKAGREMGEYIGSNGGAVEYPENMITLITRTCSITLQTPWLLSASPPQIYFREKSPFCLKKSFSSLSPSSFSLSLETTHICVVSNIY